MSAKDSSGIHCERCGFVSLKEFQSCPQRETNSCPYILQGQPSFVGCGVGIICFSMGIIFIFGMGILPFSMYRESPVTAFGLITGVLLLTFAFSIANFFVAFGLGCMGIRRWLFCKKDGSSYVELFNIFGFPLAYRLIKLKETVVYSMDLPPLPFSLAGFLKEENIWQQETQKMDNSLSLSPKLHRFQEMNRRLDSSIANALLGAILTLTAHSCIVIRKVIEEHFSSWYTAPIPPRETYYLFPGEGDASGLGMLEEDMMKKIHNWHTRQGKVQDMVAPTVEDWIKTFEDSDGDFSSFQIRKLLIAEGEARQVINKKAEGLLGKLCPTIEIKEEAKESISEVQSILRDSIQRITTEYPSLASHLLSTLKKVVCKEPPKTLDPVEQESSALRKKLLYYIVGISFSLAFVLCLIASR